MHVRLLACELKWMLQWIWILDLKFDMLITITFSVLSCYLDVLHKVGARKESVTD